MEGDLLDVAGGLGHLLLVRGSWSTVDIGVGIERWWMRNRQSRKTLCWWAVAAG